MNISLNQHLTDDPAVSIVILNYNGERDTIACLHSLRELEYTNYEILVIDNGSEKVSVNAIRNAFPSVEVFCSESNLGFAAGNNLGLRRSIEKRFPYTLLLNNDTEIDPTFLTKLVKAAEADPQIAMLGPTIYYFDEPNRIWSAGGNINWSRGKAEMIGIDEIDANTTRTQCREVDFVTGCALLVRMSSLEAIGLLDPRFFLYYEEVEWCARALTAGYKVCHVPQSKLWHKISPEHRDTSPLVHYYMTRNRLLFLDLANLGIRAWIQALLFDYARTLISWSLRPKWRSKRALRNVMLKAIADYYRGRFGPVDALHQSN